MSGKMKEFIKSALGQNSRVWRVLSRSASFLRQISTRFKYREVAGKTGLEIGGPSSIFRPGGELPLYSLAEKLDGCNFAEKTVWEGDIKEGRTYHYLDGRENGRQFICDAVSLAGISDNSYDFVLASHVLEHVANPIKAAKEWLRVLKPGGMLLIIVPDKRGTFDHRRPITAWPHLLDDFQNAVGEDDLTHLPEIISLHDFGLDPLCGGQAKFEERAKDNHNNRCLHHHVFDETLLTDLLEYLGAEVQSADRINLSHIVVKSKKSSR